MFVCPSLKESTVKETVENLWERNYKYRIRLSLQIQVVVSSFIELLLSLC